MAFNEGKHQLIDLLGAMQVGRQNKQNDNNSKIRDQLQNQLMQEQIKAAEWNNLVNKQMSTATVKPDKTAGMLTGEFGNFLNLRQPISEMPGYVTGTNPAQYEAEQMAIRNTLAAGNGGGGGRGQTQEEANALNQQANLTEEQARQAQYQRQGYGSADRGLMEQKTLDQSAANAEANRQNQMDIAKLYSGAKENVAAIENYGDALADEQKKESAAAKIVTKSYAGNPTFKGMGPDLQQKTVATYSALTNSDGWKKLPAHVQQFATTELPNIIAANGGDITGDISLFIKRIKEAYNEDRLSRL
jgi:hypothetical protein